MTIRDVLSRLRKVRKNAKGWSACCPSHDDKHPSLGVWLMPDGNIALKCYSGCSGRDVWAALGNPQRPRHEYVRSSSVRGSPIDFESMLQRWRQDTVTIRLERLATSLGVSVESLKRLGTVYWKEKNAWAFPMRNPIGMVCGIRVRSESGNKWAVEGSAGGLFIPSNQRPDGPIGICEGPTEAAAIMDLEYAVVGRQSCNSVVPETIEYIKSLPRRDIVIFCNRDIEHKTKQGRTFYPGQDGAIALAKEIGKPLKIILPPSHKDFRDWLKAGATKGDVDYLIQNTGWTVQTRAREGSQNRFRQDYPSAPGGSALQITGARS